jgi:phosphatidylinositol alpha-mannosyltransferase
MKIGMISLYLPSGSKIGSGYQAHYMATALAHRGHEVTMHTPCAPVPGAPYRTVTLDVGNSLRTFRFAWRLRHVDWNRFDVIHAHGDDYWLWNIRPPHIRTMHGSCFAEAVHIPGLWNKLRMLMLGTSEVLATLAADRTVCVSQNTRRHYPWVRNVILNGVDTSAFRPGGVKESTPTILFVGTLHNRKRGAALLEAFKNEIRPALPSAQMWMVCGDGPAVGGVTYFKDIPMEQLADLYRRAWVFCLPSSYEGFGVPYIEAMASGTPVVATPNVGAVEVLGDGKWGVLTPIERIAPEILRLLRDPAERDRLTRAGLERVQDFSWDHILSQYERTYAECGAGAPVTPAPTSTARPLTP